MKIRRLMTKQFCLGVGAALTLAGVMVSHRTGPEPSQKGEGVVYVYFSSLCSAAGDSSDCQKLPQTYRPAFESMAACSAYADVELGREHNPKLMASCLRLREV
jgi:hypothetical protein